MGPKTDIGWDFGDMVGENRKKIKCKFCQVVTTGGITRLKQHIAHISGEVEACKKAPKEISLMLRKHLQESKTARELMKKRKETTIMSIREESRPIHDVDTESSSENDDEQGSRYANKEYLSQMEKKQLRNAMRESRKQAFDEEERMRYNDGHTGGTSRGQTSGTKRGIFRSSSVREGPKKSSSGVDPFMFPSKQKSLKQFFAPQKIKAVGKAISKWFLFNAIPFNAADSGPYYQSMINTIAEAGTGIMGPSGRQIGSTYLDEEVSEIDGYISTLKAKWPEYGCTIMCDGWSTKNKHPIINFMIYCDRSMIYHTSVDCTDKIKNADFILSLINKVIDEIGEQNVVQVVTDSEASNKAAGKRLMLERPHIFWSPCAAHCIDLMLEDIGKMTKIKRCIEKAKKITSFIYNSDKIVNLMKSYTKERELLRPGITRFATVFIAIESLVRHSMELKRMCTTSEWEVFNNTTKRRSEAENVSSIILNNKFWSRAREVCSLMEPLVKVLKLVDQDKKATLPIVYEAMDRAKMAIKETVKDWQTYWAVIDERWYKMLHQDLHAAAYFLNPMLQYSGTCVNTDEVRQGLKAVIKRLEPDIDAQAQAMNEVRVFVDKIGEFGSALAQKAVKTTLPAEWWLNYGEDAPHLRRIAVKVLSQTCSSSGCERNWSTWSLIHTKIRNRLAVAKLHKLVFVHYNMRLKVRNLMYKSEEDDYYNPIDLNHVFHDDDILDDWTRENEAGVFADDDLQWLDGDVRGAEPESEANVPSRANKRNVDPRSAKMKGKATTSKGISIDVDTTDDSDDTGDGNDQEITARNEESRGGQGHDDSGASWAQGRENFYATQDTDHGYRPGIEEQRRYLAGLQGFSSADDHHSNPHEMSRRYRNVDGHMQGLSLGGNEGQPRYGYGVSNENFGSQNMGYNYGQSSFASQDRYRYPLPYGAIGVEQHGHRYGYSANTSGMRGDSEDYYNPAHNIYREPLSSGIGYNYESSRSRSMRYNDPYYASSDSSGYRGFGYYHHNHEASAHTDSSHASNEPRYGRFESLLPNDSQGENIENFEPARHSTWY